MGRRDDDEDDGDEGVPPGEADAALRFGLSLLLSLALAGPALWAALEGRRDLEGALLHYLLCFVVARVAVGVVASLYGGYRRAQPRPTGPPVRPVTGPLSESR